MGLYIKKISDITYPEVILQRRNFIRDKAELTPPFPTAKRSYEARKGGVNSHI